MVASVPLRWVFPVRSRICSQVLELCLEEEVDLRYLAYAPAKKRGKLASLVDRLRGSNDEQEPLEESDAQLPPVDRTTMELLQHNFDFFGLPEKLA